MTSDGGGGGGRRGRRLQGRFFYLASEVTATRAKGRVLIESRVVS